MVVNQSNPSFIVLCHINYGGMRDYYTALELQLNKCIFNNFFLILNRSLSTWVPFSPMSPTLPTEPVSPDAWSYFLLPIYVSLNTLTIFSFNTQPRLVL